MDTSIVEPQASAVPQRTVSMAVISTDPLIVYTSRANGFGFGMAGPFSDCRPAVPATFLVYFPWSQQTTESAGLLRADLRAWQARGARQNIILCANSAAEQAFLREAGIPTVLLNQNVVLSERDFTPAPDATVPAFDAVYNAKLDAWKRHELAFQIDRVAYVTYYWPGQGEKEPMRQRLALLSARPGHQVMNPLDDGLPVYLSRDAVNRVYGQAAVGLCLSAFEGPMLASLEYLLAGLPIVTTPSVGGRDHFFDDAYCITAPPDPRQIRDAVMALRDRRIPRNHIRQETLKKVEAERRRGEALLNFIYRTHRQMVPAGAAFPLVGQTLDWQAPEVHLARLRAVAA